MTSVSDEASPNEQELKDQRQRLHEHFNSLEPDKHSHAWDGFWREGVTPVSSEFIRSSQEWHSGVFADYIVGKRQWDRNRPQPALVEALHNKPELLGSLFKDVNGAKTRKTALVPGCGRGYDVLLFASYGLNAVGLDISPTAVEEARKVQADQGRDQQYPVKNIQAGRGEARFITADFFMNNFLAETHGTPQSDRTFDIIYDYTFLCALPPSLRPQWAARMSELLAPTGRLICMEYPLGKDPKSGGPPHGLDSELYEQLLAKPGNEVNYNSSGHVCEDRSGEKSNNGLVKIEHWKPDRTFDGQEKQLMVSVWKHWKS